MKAKLSIIRKMVQDYIFKIMEISIFLNKDIKDNLKMINSTDKVVMNGLMEIILKDNLSMI